MSEGEKLWALPPAVEAETGVGGGLPAVKKAQEKLRGLVEKFKGAIIFVIYRMTVIVGLEMTYGIAAKRVRWYGITEELQRRPPTSVAIWRVSDSKSRRDISMIKGSLVRWAPFVHAVVTICTESDQ